MASSAALQEGSKELTEYRECKTALEHGKIVKTNRLIEAISYLSTKETRVLHLAISDARSIYFNDTLKKENPASAELALSSSRFITVTAARYAETYNVLESHARDVLRDVDLGLRKKRLVFLDETGRLLDTVWVQAIRYSSEDRGYSRIDMKLSDDLVRNINNIGGKSDPFTSYKLKSIVDLSCIYSIRLFELMNKWRSAKSIPSMTLDKLRQQLSVPDDAYPTTASFSQQVIKRAVNEINKKTDILVKYKPVKQGRTIIAFKFTCTFLKRELIKNIDPPLTADDNPEKKPQYFLLSNGAYGLVQAREMAMRLSDLDCITEVDPDLVGLNLYELQCKVMSDLQNKDRVFMYKEKIVLAGLA